MANELDRRQLLTTLGGAVAFAAAGAGGAHAERSPARAAGAPRRLARPFAIGSDNCLKSKSAAGASPMTECLSRLEHGERTLDAIVAGIEICELDPEDPSVGYGGLPNAEGVVQLDAALMDGRSRRAGGVGALEGVRTPSRVALAVADQTDHHLLVGAGAQAFARQMGFAIEADLNTERSRRAWLEWKRALDPLHWLDPGRPSPGAAAAERARHELMASGRLDPLHASGTIHLSVVAKDGAVASCTSTSGLSFKLPGRVGDSPILGAGLYCEAEVGAAGSTGRGEANLADLSSAWIVDEMRRGAHPKDAAMAALERVRRRPRPPHLTRPNGEPLFNLQFYVLNLAGDFAAVSLYGDYRGSIPEFAVGDAHGVELARCDALLENVPKDEPAH